LSFEGKILKNADIKNGKCEIKGGERKDGEKNNTSSYGK
jgi:hypothetical protein